MKFMHSGYLKICSGLFLSVGSLGMLSLPNWSLNNLRMSTVAQAKSPSINSNSSSNKEVAPSNSSQSLDFKSKQLYGCPGSESLRREYSSWSKGELEYRLNGDRSGYTPSQRPRQESLMSQWVDTAKDGDLERGECLMKEIDILEELIQKKKQEADRPKPFVPRRICNSVDEYQPFDPYGCIFPDLPPN